MSLRAPPSCSQGATSPAPRLTGPSGGRTRFLVAGMAVLNLFVAGAAVTGIVVRPTPQKAPAEPVVAMVPVTVHPWPRPATTLAEVPTTTAQPQPASPRTTVPRQASPTTIAPRSDRIPGPGAIAAPTPGPLPAAAPEDGPPVDASEATVPVARRQPSRGSLVPVSPTPEQVGQHGDRICTALDEDRTAAHVRATGRAMAEEAPFAGVRRGGENCILRSGVDLYCPGHAARLG